MAAPAANLSVLANNPFKSVAGVTWAGGANPNAINALTNPTAEAWKRRQALMRARNGAAPPPPSMQDQYGATAPLSYGGGRHGSGGSLTDNPPIEGWESDEPSDGLAWLKGTPPSRGTSSGIPPASTEDQPWVVAGRGKPAFPTGTGPNFDPAAGINLDAAPLTPLPDGLMNAASAAAGGFAGLAPTTAAPQPQGLYGITEEARRKRQALHSGSYGPSRPAPLQTINQF